MKLYKHIELAHANKIIEMANKKMTVAQINRETGITRGKINRVLDRAKVKKMKIRINQQWKGPIVKISYSKRIYRNTRDQIKMEKAYKFAEECEPIYDLFISFCKKLYEKKILGVRAKRSADEFIKEFRREHPGNPFPCRSWVYRMANSIHYKFQSKWLPSSKAPKMSLKSDDEAKKGAKYNELVTRASKDELRKEPGNFEIDSVIGKREDKTALLTLIDIHTGDFYIAPYGRTMGSFKDAFSSIIKKNDLEIKTLTMDNGGENNELDHVIDRSKLYNCRPYCSGEKGTLENKHRLIRRIIPKGKSMDTYSAKDIMKVQAFVNNYYTKIFNNI